MRLLGFDPQHVCAVLQAGDAVQNNTVFARARLEAEQARGQTLRLQQLAVGLDHNVAVLDLGSVVDVLAVQEAVVLVAQVTRLVGYRDLLGQASTQGVSTGNDHTVIHTQFQERQANRVDLGQEVSVRNGYFTVLVTTLLLVRNLVFDLDTASTGFDHLLGQQVGGFGVTETSVDVRNDGHNVGFVVVDLLLDFLGLSGVTSFLGLIQSAEQVVQFPGIGLTQEGVQLFDQARNRSLLVHGLVRQRAELGTQGGNHPARQVQVTTLGGTEVLLDGDHLLLADETVPATQRLSVLGRIGIVSSHVFTHDLGGVLGDVQTSLELVLGAHAGRVLRVDGVPGRVLLQNGSDLVDVLCVRHDLYPFYVCVQKVRNAAAGSFRSQPPAR